MDRADSPRGTPPDGIASPPDDERAIRDVLARWFAATKAGDTPTVLSLMTDDVVFMVPGRVPFGKEAFQNAADTMKDARIDGTTDVQELRVVGNWAYVRTHITVTVTPSDGPAVTRSGHTLSIFQREADGKWRLARDANLLTVQK
jgi:uncharacterized protein (TIGR02246 family)